MKADDTPTISVDLIDLILLDPIFVKSPNFSNSSDRFFHGLNEWLRMHVED